MNIKQLLEKSGYSFLEYYRDLYTTSKIKFVLLSSKTNKELFIGAIVECMNTIFVYDIDDYQKQINSLPDTSTLKIEFNKNIELFNTINMLT